MSLRTTYTGALDIKLAEARVEGRKIVIDINNEPNPVTSLSGELTASANKGEKTFTYNASVGYQPQDLRLNGALWEAFKTGVLQGLSEQDIMFNEVAVVLNVSDASTTTVDLNFTF